MEVFLMFVVMGVITAIVLPAVKPLDKTLSYSYSRAYQSLYDAGLNIYLDTVSAGFPATPNAMCTSLTTYINSLGTACSVSASAVPRDGSSFPTADQQFTATNGMIFYISNVYTYSAADAWGSLIGIKYRMIFVDLNGTRKPNTATYTDKVYADIVGFVMTNTGEVIPVGQPIINNKYISAQVVYTSVAGSDPTYSPPMPFHDAKCMASGDKPYAGTQLSYDFTTVFTSGPLYIPPQAACTAVAACAVKASCNVEIYKKVDL